MASLLDSEAQFLQRANDFRLSESTLRRLKTAGLNTFGILAYARGQDNRLVTNRLRTGLVPKWTRVLQLQM